MTHRIIMTGKNSAFPKTIRLPFGFHVDGTPHMRPVRIRANQCKCRVCDGWGTVTYSPINPSERDYSERCTVCDGEGIATVSA